MSEARYGDDDYDGDRPEDFYDLDENDPVRHGDYYEPQSAFLDLGRI